MELYQQIRKFLKQSFDRIRNERLKQNLLQALPFWVASVITGLIAVFYARLFVLAEKGTAYVLRHHEWLLFLITPVCFVLAWWVVKRFAGYSRGSGIPQVMAAIELAKPKYSERINQLLSIRIIIVKMISSLVMVIGGGIIGREGPTIQIAGSVFRKVNQWLPDWYPKISKRNMIMTGAAAGLAAAFNTPLGGIVFAVEELAKTHLSHFKTALFTAVIISGLTAQALAGPYLYLGYPEVGNLSPYIFLAIVMVAILAGLAGSGMSKVMLALLRWKSGFKKNWHQVGYVIGCALVVVILAFFVDMRMLGSGKDLMASTLFTDEKYLPWYMPLLRMTGSVLSFTTGAAGGVFAPALSSGATIGATIAGWFQLSDANTNILILSGMVAFLTGITRTPFTSAILVLEMTDRHSVIFHLMLAGMIASIAAIIVDRHSFYDRLRDQYMKDILHESNPAPSESTTNSLSGPDAAPGR